MGQTVQIMNATQQQIRVYSFIETWVHVSVCLFVLGYFLYFPVGALGMKTTSHPRYKQDVLPHWFREHPAQCWWRQDVLPTEGNALNGRITNDPRLGGGKMHVTRSRPMGWADIGFRSALPVGTWLCVATALAWAWQPDAYRVIDNRNAWRPD